MGKTSKAKSSIKQVAQGDVLFTRVGNAETKKIDNLKKPISVLEGEASGHFHNVHGQAVYFRPTEMGLDLGTIEVGPKGAEIRHEVSGKPTSDHDKIALPSGKYKISRQREFIKGASTFVED